MLLLLLFLLLPLVCFPPRFGTPHSPSLVVVVSPLRASGRTERMRSEDGLINLARAAAYMRGSRRGLENARGPARACYPLASAFANGKRPLVGQGPEGPREVEPLARHSSPAAGLPRNPPSGTSGTSPPSQARLGLNFDFGRLANWLISPLTQVISRKAW